MNHTDLRCPFCGIGRVTVWHERGTAMEEEITSYCAHASMRRGIWTPSDRAAAIAELARSAEIDA